MKTRIFIFMVMFMMIVGCVSHSTLNENFIIFLSTGYKERTTKDYIECWINDSLVFRGLYVNKTDYEKMMGDYYGDWIGMKIANFDKNGYDSIKVKIRVTSLDTVLYCGKKMIDSTFKYQIDNLPFLAISCDADGGIMLWDTLRTPDYFYFE